MRSKLSTKSVNISRSDFSESSLKYVPENNEFISFSTLCLLLVTWQVVSSLSISILLSANDFGTKELLNEIDST